jgi:predicted ribosomally synthesized peptide with nif11-like leader
LQLFSTREES